MPGRLLNWPAWPEFAPETAEANEDLVQYKQDIISEYGKDSIRRSWLRVCKELEVITEDLAVHGSAVIPDLTYEQLLTSSPQAQQRMKDVGCFVVRGVVDEQCATKWYQDLKVYVADNRENITGWPEPTPFVHNVYFTPTQLAARSHPNMLRIAQKLNTFWHDSSNLSSPKQLSYADALRIRPPKSGPLLGIGPHIDAGSLSRWADPIYRSCYKAVFSGQPEELDLYDLKVRKNAKQACFTSPGHSSVLRAFQGWTALTPAGPGEGSLMLYPAVKWSIAYIMLRPFFSQPAKAVDVLDASKWTFDPTTTFFPGTFRQMSQKVSPSSHPHLRLRDCMVSIPKMMPGDTVWWHADMCHAVEADHEGENDACVVYIAATPTTSQNKSYIESQREDFLTGRAPEDFRSGRKDGVLKDERYFKGYVGEKAILSDQGRRAMGFPL